MSAHAWGASVNNHPCDIYRVARQCGVILRDSAEHSPTSRRPCECYTKATLRDIGRAYGKAHLALVLRPIVETGSATELHAATIHAVSSVLLSGQMTIDGALFDAFDRIDLGRLRAWARRTEGSDTTASNNDRCAARAAAGRLLV
jgi:hypothetical protein